MTYHKHEEIEATVAYGDEFIDETTMRWFTRSRRSLQSGEVKAIVEHQVVPHVFVKQGLDFLYLGSARAEDAVDETMPDGDGGRVAVVTMNLVFDRPIERGLYDYLTMAPDTGAPALAESERSLLAEVSWASSRLETRTAKEAAYAEQS